MIIMNNERLSYIEVFVYRVVHIWQTYDIQNIYCVFPHADVLEVLHVTLMSPFSMWRFHNTTGRGRQSCPRTDWKAIALLSRSGVGDNTAGKVTPMVIRLGSFRSFNSTQTLVHSQLNKISFKHMISLENVMVCAHFIKCQRTKLFVGLREQ